MRRSKDFDVILEGMVKVFNIPIKYMFGINSSLTYYFMSAWCGANNIDYKKMDIIINDKIIRPILNDNLNNKTVDEDEIKTFEKRIEELINA